MLEKRRSVAQPGSALYWGCRGRGFESRHSDQLHYLISAAIYPLLALENCVRYFFIRHMLVVDALYL